MCLGARLGSKGTYVCYVLRAAFPLREEYQGNPRAPAWALGSTSGAEKAKDPYPREH